MEMIDNYDPLAPITVHGFRTLLVAWDKKDPCIEHILTGMITVLKLQGFDSEVDSILKEFGNEQI